jgi:nitrogen fixation protein FixH
MKSPLNPLRGWHVLIMILIFFGVTIGVNATFITLAIGTYPGEDVPRSYVQGINYNDRLEQRRIQAELGWSAQLNRVGDDVIVEVLDRDNARVSGLNLLGQINHPTDTSRDCIISLREDDDALYRTRLSCHVDAGWRIKLHNDGDLPFEMEHEL